MNVRSKSSNELPKNSSPRVLAADDDTESKRAASSQARRRVSVESGEAAKEARKPANRGPKNQSFDKRMSDINK